jgi:hypothetical protein
MIDPSFSPDIWQGRLPFDDVVSRPPSPVLKPSPQFTEITVLCGTANHPLCHEKELPW